MKYTLEWDDNAKKQLKKYRVLCDIKDNILVVIAVKVGHRKDVYKRF